MASTNPTTKRKLETTKVGEEVLDLVIPYIHKLDDRNSVSLVSRNVCEIVGITRKRLTLHTLYYPNPASLSKRFPFIEALTLKGPPSDFNVPNDSRIRITPWIDQLAHKFRCLKELHIHGMVLNNKDLEILATTRGKDLTSLKFKKCKGFSTEGLRHVFNYCNQLTTFCLKRCCCIGAEADNWLHQLALNSTALERLHVTNMYASRTEDVTLLARKCCNSLISLNIGPCYLTKLGDALRYAVRLERFGGDMCEESASVPCLRGVPIWKFYMPRMYVETGDCNLLVKKLRKLYHDGLVTHVGLIALAKGCPKLECLKVRVTDIVNEALECLGTHLKNLRKFSMKLDKMDVTTYLPLLLDRTTYLLLDNGIQAILMGCSQLERLDISLCHWYGGLTDVGLEYIAKYGANLRSLSLTRAGNSNAGLVKLSQGCPLLRKLKLTACPFSEKVVTRYVFNIPSLRYVWFDNTDCESIDHESSDHESSDHESSDCGSSDHERSDHESSDRVVLELTRPEFPL